MRAKLLHAIAWVSARHVAHFEAQKELAANIGSFFMKMANPELFNYYAESLAQQNELQEIKALSAALEIKKMASDGGGWVSHHAIGLDMVAEVLVLQHGWDEDDVNDFVHEISDGYFNFGDGYEDEDED